MQSYIVGITGGSGSGKTFFLKKLQEYFKEDQLCMISQDDYYLPREHQPRDSNGIENYDTPHSIDLKKFISDLNSLRKGNTIHREEYTFNNPQVVPKLLTYKPAPIILVEGIFIFYLPEILQLLDLKIYIDAEEHIKLERRIMRDGRERGYDIQDVMYRFEHHVNPTYLKYIRPFREHADVIILNNNGFERALMVIRNHLEAQL
jgi:uridine kinase